MDDTIDILDDGDLEPEERAELRQKGFVQEGQLWFHPDHWQSCTSKEADWWCYESNFKALSPQAKEWVKENV